MARVWPLTTYEKKVNAREVNVKRPLRALDYCTAKTFAFSGALALEARHNLDG